MKTARRGKAKMVECVGGPLCGGLLGIFPDEVRAELSDGDYVRRLRSTYKQRSDPLWILVNEKLDWRERKKTP